MTEPTRVHLVLMENGPATACGAAPVEPAPGDLVTLCPECHDVALGRTPMADPEPLGAAEELGLLVGAMYGQALAERDQAVAHLRALVDLVPESSWAHINAPREAAVAWLDEYDTQAETVGSAQKPEEDPR